jgi:hypothetical protein
MSFVKSIISINGGESANTRAKASSTTTCPAVSKHHKEPQMNAYATGDGDGKYLRHHNIALNIAVDGWVAFDTHKAMLLGVVQPVTCATSPNQAMQLVRFDPNQLIHAVIAPDLQAFSSKLHSTTCRSKSRTLTTDNLQNSQCTEGYNLKLCSQHQPIAVVAN